VGRSPVNGSHHQKVGALLHRSSGFFDGVHWSSYPASRQHAARVSRHEITCAKLHTLRTQRCGDIRTAADEHRGLWWTRERDQASRAPRKVGTRAARVPGVQGHCGTSRRDRRGTDPEVTSRHHHCVSEGMNSG
jgi:hypothetical protein